LVGDRRALFETLAAADCTDDVKASKKAQRPVTLRMADPLTTITTTAAAAAATEKSAVTCSDDNDSGVVVVSDKKESSETKTSASITGSRETLSDVVAVVADEDGGSAPSTEDRTTDVATNVVVPDQLPLLPDVGPPVISSPPTPPLPDDSNRPDDETVVEPLKHVQIQPISDDLKQVLELPPASRAPSEEQLESPEDYEIKTLSNKLLKMDYYESNKEVPVPSPRKRIKSPLKTNYPDNLNPFDDEDDDDNKNKNDSTNPFGSDLEDEDLSAKKNVSLNPFSSDEEDNEPVSQPPLPKPRTVLSPILKPRYQTHRKQSSASSISSYSNTPRKKKPAPPPPVSRLSLGNIEYSNNTQVSSPNSLEDSSCSGSEPSSTTNQERYRLHKSTHGKWKRKKGPAPQCPIPQRRRIKPMPMEDIKQELLDIEIKQQELERQGVKLEKDIRLKCNEDLNNVDVEEMVLQLFELVNEKNELFRKHAELMYLRKQHNFEEEHAELEYQIRVLMSKPDHTKTDTEKAREEELIRRLVEVVERRNEIVENLEKDRLREAEEDRSVFNQIGTFAQDETLPCIKPVNTTVMEGKKNFSKRLLKNIKKVKSKKDKQEVASPSQSPSNSSHSKGTLKKFMTLGHSSKKLLRPKSS